MKLWHKGFTQLSPTQAQGRDAEEEARHWLEQRGYRLLSANFTTRLGEVDLIMEQGDAVVFVEVRTRAHDTYGTAAETVTRKKQARIAKAALMFVKARGLAGRPLRFDIVTVRDGRVTHLENAFAPPGYTL